MFYNKQHDQYISENAAFTLDGVQYPANWLNNASAKEKANLGLVEVQVVGHKEDDRFYWVSSTLSDGIQTWVNTPKELPALKEQWTAQVNQTAYSLLFPSDWMVIRAAEGTPIPAEWSQYRADVRAVTNRVKSEIEMSFNIPSLQAAVTDIQWPHDPNYVPPTTEQA